MQIAKGYAFAVLQVPEGYTAVLMTNEQYGAIGACIEQAADLCNEVPDRNEGEAAMTRAINLLLAEWRRGL